MQKQALISVSESTGVVEFARALQRLGFGLLSFGPTAKRLLSEGVDCTEVPADAGVVDILPDGLQAAIAARRESPRHMKALSAQGIAPIDLVCVNLYPFDQIVARQDCTPARAVEAVDISGPALIRAAAKNYASVTVLVDPGDYARVIAALQNHGDISQDLRFALAKKAFAHTARYDGMVGNYLTSLRQDGDCDPFPDVLTRQWTKVQTMRYGENPHQTSAFYREPFVAPGLLAGYEQLHGKALSYNNIADCDIAWNSVRDFTSPACVIVKHANPCGVAIGPSAARAYEKAFQTDSMSALGGVIAFNRQVDLACAERVARQFAEVVAAPGFTPEAISLLSDRKNLRLLVVAPGTAHNDLEFKRIGGGMLVQRPDVCRCSETTLRCVTKRQPTSEQIADMMFAWNVVRFVKSNAVVYAGRGMTLGIGAGQMSRLDAAHMAEHKARNAGLSLSGSVAASDGFFPFRDVLDMILDAGVTAVIQPGGSIRDQEVIDAADERDIVMMMTGERHFRH